jgi:hypothetical protein
MIDFKIYKINLRRILKDRNCVFYIHKTTLSSINYLYINFIDDKVDI